MTATTTDIAKRVYDHTWKLDPIVRSLLDTDFYKLLMLQMIWKMHRDVQVRFSLINRKQSVRLADEIELKDLCAPRCTVDGSCPRDVPSGTTAPPDCAIEEDNERLCALVCVPAAAAAGCPDGASCKAIQGVGLCTYDNDATRRSFLRRA